jgi:PAS domain S-box-containing protein
MDRRKLRIFLRTTRSPLRFLTYFLMAVLVGNLIPLADLVRHPELPYFHTEHWIVGSMLSFLTIILCVLIEKSYIQGPTTTSTLAPRLKAYVGIYAAFWTLIVISSLIWNIVRQQQDALQVGINQARTIYQKDLVYYRWATEHGRVYVPITKKTQPNPYLQHLPEYEGFTSAGTELTLVNPEYMIRQVYEMQTPVSGILGHITSLNPIRSENAADPWEKKALNEFEKGVKEVYSVEEINGEPYLRLMRPMITEYGCLKCHAQQGYHLNDIRGGISVSVPMSLLFFLNRKDIFMFSLAHGSLWILGLLGIFLESYRINQSTLERDQAEARTKSIIDNMLDSLITMHPNGIIESVNSATCKMFGYKSGELIGEDIDMLIEFPATQYWTGEQQNEPDFDIRDAAKLQNELTGKREDGSIFPIAISLSEMELGPNQLLIATVRNITEEKIRKTEALRAGQLAAIGELAAGVAHEINNPINGIINYSQILLDDHETEEQGDGLHQDILRRIIKEGERIAVIVRNLLSFARQRDEFIDDIHIHDIIKDSLSLLMHQFQKDGIQLNVNVSSNLPTLKGNPQQLQQVFVNLFTNACYALNQKYPGRDSDKRLEIASSVVNLEGRDFVRTTVTDWGTGIAQDVINHIFDTLFTTKPPGKGTGLGLSISKGLVRDHHGHLTLTSTPGNPTVATLDLPVSKSSAKVEGKSAGA